VSLDHASEQVAEAVLAAIGVEGACYRKMELREPWSLAFPDCPDGGVGFQFVAAGRCWLHDEGRASALHEGDLIVFPRATGHLISHDAEAASPPLLMPADATLADDVHHGSSGDQTLLLCGGTRFTPPDHPLVEALPRTLLVRTSDGDDADWVSSTLRVMGIEVTHQQPGSSTVVTRLVDILIIKAVRAWLQSDQEPANGWLGALRDPHLGRALVAIHEDPAAPWTVRALATEAAMSRASFSARFASATGMAPMRYVTRHRMSVATWLMRDQGLTPEQAALAVGYGSVAAFSRAYKRARGTTPARARLGEANAA
jgi:AraC-like DNA-binding protein